MNNEQTISKILAELEKAETKHPIFAHNLTQGISLITEELGEAAQAVNDYTFKSQIKR